MYNPEKERRLKVGLFIAIGLINVSVFCIWVPARLQISETFIRANNIWDRMEKAIFAVIDLCLNAYFMHLVKSKLVAHGLTQYMLVYKFNLVMVTISISLDVILIGFMSLRDDAVYVQVHPLVYLTKLNIEMNMAELLGKVVKRSNELRSSMPSTDVWQPRLGPMDVFDHEWLGSAKDFIMPRGGDTHNTGGGAGGGGTGQMHELNLDILQDSNPDKANASSMYLQSTFLEAPLQAGISLIPFCAVLMSFTGIAAMGVERTRRYLWEIWLGWIILSVGVGLFGSWGTEHNTTMMPAGFQVVAGIGLGTLFIGPPIPMQASVERVKDQGLAVGILVTFRLFGTLLGLVIAATAFGNQFAASVAGLGPLPAQAAILENPNEALSFIPYLRHVQLPAETMSCIRDAYAQALRAVFHILEAFGGVGFFASLFTRESAIESKEAGKQGFVG
ncbi:hypothetical protein N0V88_006887 [Collariella sp. IMI 366227]|nr:hypothetical protein N0V88_006887 [Collariella sp. IMI 366227]